MSGEGGGVWRLDGARCTLLLLSRDGSLPEIVHWGARLPALSEAEVRAMRDRAVAPNALDEDVPFATLLPSAGIGLFGSPGLLAHRHDADWTAQFALVSVEQAEHRLIVRARDAVLRAEIAITLYLPAAGDVLEQTSDLSVDAGAAPLSVVQLCAGTFLLPSRAQSLLSFGARWGREFAEHPAAVEHGTFSIENRRGRTSHDRTPLLVAGTPGLAEDAGEAWAIHLGWSGNHRITAERDPDGSLLVAAGALLHPGEGDVSAEEPMLSPCAFAAYAPDGLAGLSRALHRHVRQNVLRWPGGAMSPRPVTLNTWEGTYFAHDEARLMLQVEAAARLGVERFVLDDGWMQGRNDATAGLGDWIPDLRKYPRGLLPLAERVVGLGMQFGLWVEPEMANPDSDFLRAHPDAALQVPGRPRPTARHQLVLDLARLDVFEPVHGALDALLRTLPISYLKWDMNRDLAAAGDAEGRAAYDRHVFALYALIDRLRHDHPALEIETCASGGGRADYGILARTHRVWTSDCTDALDRLAIQRGALRFLPPEILGAHVSASPNHQTGRRHTLGFRCAVALFFHMGVELDPLTLDPGEATEVAAWIALHKRLRPLLHAGAHVSLPIDDSRSLLGVVATDRGQAAYLMAQEASPMHAIPPPLRLPGLDVDARYRVTAPAPQRSPARSSATHRRLFADGVVLPGGAWAAGVVPPPLPPESALVLHAVREGG